MIDIKWLISFVGLMTLIFGYLLLILKKSSEYIKGPALWATGSFLMGLGLVLLAWYPWPAEYPNVAISSFLIISSRSCYLVGLWQFKEKKIHYPLVIALPLFAVIQSTIFDLVINQPSVRIAINSVLYAFIAFYSFIEMLHPNEMALKYIFRINAIVFFLYGFIMLARALFAFQMNSDTFIKSTPISIAVFVLAVSMQAVLTYGFILMVNKKIAEDLKKQIAIKDLFFSIIAHDLKNQVNVITGFSELLYTSISVQDTNKNLQFASYIRQASLQTTGLLENLLDWAKIQNKVEIFNPSKNDLNELIKDEIDALSSISCNKQISIDYTCEQKPFIITVDRNMFKTILRNLLINAIKFTNQGGKIKIEIRHIPQYVEINVSDSGIGF
jgi:two-component system, sensor histidine kinase and response regulator